MEISYLKNKSILIVSPEYWGKNFVTKHHYATLLAKQNNKVFFLNPPDKKLGFVINDTDINNLKSINYPGHIKGIRFFPGFIQSLLIRLDIFRLEKRFKTKFDIIWSFDNSVFFALKHKPKRITAISHIVDLDMNFNLEMAAKTADICLAVNDIIKNELIKYQTNTYKIPHGFNPFQDADEDSFKMPGNHPTKALCIGNYSSRYIDWDIIKDAIENCQDVDFVFVGPEGDSNLGTSTHFPAKEKIKKYSNVHFLGAMPYNKLSNATKKADLTFFTFKEEFHKDRTSAHKILEFLGAGKIVVATFTAEYKNNPELVLMSNKNKEFAPLIRSVIDNLAVHNQPEMIKTRIDFANSNSYPNQLKKIDTILKDHSERK